MPTPKLIGTGRKVASRVVNPGEKGYHEIDEAVREGSHVRRVHDSDRKWDRANGKVVAGLTATTTAAPLILLPPLNRGARKRTEAANAKAKTIRASIGKGVKVHRISTLPPRKGVLDRLGRTTPLQASGLAMGGYGLGIGGLVAGSRGTRRRLTEAEQNLRSARREAKKAVAKSFSARLVLHNASHPKELARVVRENPWEAGIAAGGVGAAGAAGASHSKHRKGTATAAAAGAAAGQGAYYGAGFGAIRQADKLKRESQRPGPSGARTARDLKVAARRSPLSRAAQEKIWREHRKSHGVSQGKPMSVHQQRDVFMGYPKRLPGSKQQRFAARLQRGKYGRAFNAAATVGGSVTVGGAYATGARAHGRRQVSKALYQREERLSPLRVAQLGAGAGLAAWGLGRSRFLGAALARGVKAAQGKNNRQALEALQLAQAARGALRRGTTPAEHSLRQIRRVNTAINAVPAPFRPEIASAAGLLLAGHAMPLHTTRYRQVSSPVGYGR